MISTPFAESKLRPGLGGFTAAAGRNTGEFFGFNQLPGGSWEFSGIGLGKAGKGNNYWTKTGVYYGRDTIASGFKTGGMWGAGAAAMGGAFRVIPAAFIAHQFYGEYKEGGIGGAIGAIPKVALEQVALATAFTGGGRLLKGGWTGALGLMGRNWRHTKNAYSAVKAAEGGWAAAQVGAEYAGAVSGSTVGTLARGTAAVAGRVSVAAMYLAPLILGGMYISHSMSGIQRNIEAGHRSLNINTTSSLAAFNTKGAWTSRQMSVQAIQRSHLNSRSALGSEAQYMHRR